MPLPKPTKPVERKRLKEWEAWLKGFKKERRAKGQRIEYAENAAWLLNDIYWTLANQYVRPLLVTPNGAEEEHKIHPYKIISVSEITVMMVEPVLGESEEEAKQQNALLAWYIATEILEGWHVGKAPLITAEHINAVAGYCEKIDENKFYPESFAAEHLKWLVYLNVTIEKPITANAQCWRLFYLACLALAQAGKLL